MRRPQSLRARLLFGSVLWTIGLVALINAMSLLVTHAPHRIPGGVQHFIIMSSLAAGMLFAAIIEIRSILAHFRNLRARVNAVRDGRDERVSGDFPSEVQPIVSELNALLDHRAELVRRAVAKAGDLAHGLKTPLAVIGQEAERLQAAGHAESAAVVGQQVDRMRRQIDYHLAHARAAASGPTLGAVSPVLASVEGLVRTLTRLYVEKGVSISVAVPAAHRVRVQSEDLDEMLGNLLDNACKWGSHVRIESHQQNGSIAILLDDDGPGIAVEQRTQVLQRGVRADEAAPGSGLGLAIVRDLAELHGGSIALEASPPGGTRARLVLPAS